jgi:dCTP deaminase
MDDAGEEREARAMTMETNPPADIPVRQAAYTTGILPSQVIWEMVRTEEIAAVLKSIEEDQVQPASIDLRLGTHAYPVDTSFLPGRKTKVLEKMAQLDADFERYKIDLRQGAVLEKGRVYVVPLLESIKLKSDVAAFANPKSSTGRLDILTRLIADEATHFDQVENGYQGELYIEIAPRSFSVVARTGTRLNQLRFRRTRGVAPRPITAADWNQLLNDGLIVDVDKDADPDADADAGQAREPGMLPFTVDLKGPGSEDALIGWRAKKNTKRIDLDRRDYDPLDFWEPLRFRREPSLTLVPDDFYILMTKEAIAVPPNYAAEMLPYDTRAGEFRVHYAGFFDPGFGLSAANEKAGSSRGVLEVRSHEVPFLLEHGQTVGWLRYERMAEAPKTLYGQGIRSNYQGQSLKLAKQFKQP